MEKDSQLEDILLTRGKTAGSLCAIDIKLVRVGERWEKTTWTDVSNAAEQVINECVANKHWDKKTGGTL